MSRARVPVVKVAAGVHPSGISFDVVVNNSIALANSRLLATYAAYDPRARALIFLVGKAAASYIASFFLLVAFCVWNQ